MNKPLFFHDSTTLQEPEDIIPFLARGELHWKAGRSAYELAYSWIGANGIPEPVSRVLYRDPRWRDAKLKRGLFEKKTDLGTPGRDSQTDLLAQVQLPNGETGILGVEGKAGESFGPIVEEWLPKRKTGKERLAALCALLEFDVGNVNALRYQLFHRTVAAILEAQKAKAPCAIMLVHSFAEDPKGFHDLEVFSVGLGSPLIGLNYLSPAVERGGVSLQLAWVQDKRH